MVGSMRHKRKKYLRNYTRQSKITWQNFYLSHQLALYYHCKKCSLLQFEGLEKL